MQLSILLKEYEHRKPVRSSRPDRFNAKTTNNTNAMKSLTLTLLALCFTFFISCEQKKQVMEITTSSDKALELYWDARQMFSDQKPDVAIDLLNKAIELDSDFALAYAVLGGKENIDKALELIDQVTEGEFLYIKYREASLDLNWDEIFRVLNEMILLLPDDPWPHFWLASSYQSRNQDYPMAIEEFNKALELDPNHTGALNMLNYAYISNGQMDMAEETLITYIERAPDVANAYDSYAEFLMTEQRYEEAIIQYKKAIEVDPEWTMALAKIGHANAFQGDFVIARDYYDQVPLKGLSNSEKHQIYNWQAATYYSEGNVDQAIKIIGDAIEIAKIDAYDVGIMNGFYYSVWMLCLSDRAEEALDYANQSRTYFLDHQETISYSDFYDYYTLLWQSLPNGFMKDFDMADLLLDQAYDLIAGIGNTDVNLQWYNITLGYLEINRLNFEKALEAFNSAAKDNLFANFGRALAYDKMGNIDKAKENYEKVIFRRYYEIALALFQDKALKSLEELSDRE